LGLSSAERKSLAISVDESLDSKYPKRLVASAFNLSRSSLYYQNILSEKDLKLKNKILEIYKKDDTLGAKSLAPLVNASHGRIARVMLKYGIQPRRKKRSYKYAGKSDETVDNLLLDDNYKDHEALFSDIFQFRLGDGSWVYGAFVIRRSTRQILSFSYSYGMQAELVTESIQRIDLSDLKKTDVIFHSDQGRQYGAGVTVDACIEANFTRSMSRAGTPTDNAIAERFVGMFKLAVVERYSYPDIGSFEKHAEDWLNFYNSERPHGSLGRKSPDKYAREQGLTSVPYLVPIFV
jgi:putative transposase